MDKEKVKSIARSAFLGIAGIVLAVYLYNSFSKNTKQSAPAAANAPAAPAASTVPAVPVPAAVNAPAAQSLSISAADGSISAVFNVGGAQELSINGSWNRLKQAISVQSPQGEARPFDFVLGTYTHLVTNGVRPSYILTNLSPSHIRLSTDLPHSNTSLSLVREIAFNGEGFARETLVISNTGKENANLDFGGIAFTFGSLYDFANLSAVPGKAAGQGNITVLQWKDGKKIRKADFKNTSATGIAGGLAFAPNPDWMTVHDNFFLTIARPDFKNTYGVYNAFDRARKRVGSGIQVMATNIPAGGVLQLGIDYYVGPNQENAVVRFDKDAKDLYKWWPVFNLIMKPIETASNWAIQQMFRIISNAGIILILIALLVKLVLLPLSINAAVSMKKMRLLQPKISKLQEKYGNDQTLLQQKTMEMYKQEKVNPLGGCLPLLMQMPVFFILFRILNRSVELRGAGFLWIKDLTSPDALFMISGFSFNLLPIIMAALQLLTTYLQQGKMGSDAAQSDMQRQMKMQGYLMPVLFLVLFWNMPSGLVLYWTAQNVFAIIEQEAINLSHKGEKQKNY